MATFDDEKFLHTACSVFNSGRYFVDSLLITVMIVLKWDFQKLIFRTLEVSRFAQ